MTTAPGLYVHVPFCSAICPYCDFAVRVGNEADGRGFVDSLLVELDGLASGAAQADSPALAEAVAGLVSGRAGSFDTIYFGGGTPSVLAENDLRRLLKALRERLPVANDALLFFEANPEDVSAESLSLWRSLGVSMLSLGVQSFDDEALTFLGRRHTGEQAKRAVELALTSSESGGFDTVSIDLIYGLPNQTLEAWRRDLDTAIALGPQHLSCYELEIHQRTVFGKRKARGELKELPEDDQADLFLFTHRHLTEHGYEGYEVSNFASTPENRSKHNAKYWHHVPYLGLGPSAHSYAGGVRWWNERHAPRWSRLLGDGRGGVEDFEELSAKNLAIESIMLGLRTKDGIDLHRIEEEHGVDLWSQNKQRINTWIDQGLIKAHGGRIRPTLRGMAVTDRLVVELNV